MLRWSASTSFGIRVRDFLGSGLGLIEKLVNGLGFRVKGLGFGLKENLVKGSVAEKI